MTSTTMGSAESAAAAWARPMHRVTVLVLVIIPFAGFVSALVTLWGTALDWVHLAILASMYTLTGLGIGVGYHRLFTHRSFETGAALRFIFGVLGSMAIEGPLIRWVAMHRKHHQHADDPLDPHSPHLSGWTQGWGAFRGLLRGFWHAHVGWIFGSNPPDLPRYVPDLTSDRVARVVSRTFPLWVVVGLLVPAVLGGLLTSSWTGMFLGFLWGGLARVFLVHHVTWSINSVCHLWGSRPFQTHDHSRDNLIFGLLAFGEGWHNGHHAFPGSARHGLSWWKLDVNYLVIRGLAALGLARRVRLPAPERIALLRRAPGSRPN